MRVPLPDEGGSLTKALMSAVLLRAREGRQLTLDWVVTDLPVAKEIEIAWQNASEQEKASRTIFAHTTLRPEEVVPEGGCDPQRTGGFEDTERFLLRALMRLGAALTPFPGGGYGAPQHLVPEVLKERLQAEGLLDESASPKPLRIAFEARPRPGFLSIHRAHPLTGVLAESFLENALHDGASQDDPATVPRCGVWDTDAVEAVTMLLLLRVRHRLHSRGRLGPVVLLPV